MMAKIRWVTEAGHLQRSSISQILDFQKSPNFRRIWNYFCHFMFCQNLRHQSFTFLLINSLADASWNSSSSKSLQILPISKSSLTTGLWSLRILKILVFVSILIAFFIIKTMILCWPCNTPILINYNNRRYLH